MSSWGSPGSSPGRPEDDKRRGVVSALFAGSALALLATPALAQPTDLQPPMETQERRRPGGPPEPFRAPVQQINPGAIEPPPQDAFPGDHLPIPDRWRLVESIGVRERWFDPYNQNTWKGDRPLPGTEHWFLALTGISDTVIEPRSFPTPVAPQASTGPGANDIFSRPDSLVFSQTFIAGAALIQGSTAFMPPEIEVRAAVALNYSDVDVSERRILSVLPSRGSRRRDAFLGLQELFLDYHIRNVSDRYDFDSVRVGIQPFSSDFRGFLFQDNQLGVRLFGNRDNNHYQYNLAAFLRLEKDTNSGLNNVFATPRDDLVLAANLYRQDFPIPGFTSQATVVYNRNRERGDIHIDDNGFPVRPALIGDLRTREYDAVYFGYNGDGRIGRFNLTASAYGLLGEDRNNTFTGRPADIQAFFLALEPSYDRDWIRIRGSFLYASGDSNPHDDREEGFDAIFENPQFAGSDTSYWIRQTPPFAGGGRAVTLTGRNGVLNSLRSSKEEGQSNFNNPGTVLIGAGADFDLLPTLRLSANLNRLAFADTAVVEALRQQGSIPRSLGWDYSAAVIWRPRMTQNAVLRASVAVFDPGKGFGRLFGNSSRDDNYYSVLLNAALAY